MSVDGVNSTSSSSTVGSTSSGSLQLEFAKLQLEQAENAKEDAMAYMNKIKESQAEQALCAEMISRATKLMEAAKTGDCCTEMPQDMKDYFELHDLAYDTEGKDDIHNQDEWEFNIESLSAYRDQLGTSTQTDMVYVEDFMGQYNSYLTGANATIDSGNQTLQTILS